MIIELDNIHKTYNGGSGSDQRDVLAGISIVIQSGDSVAITGPSGCGKSTFLNIVGTLDKPSSGIIRINGEDISLMNDRKLAEIRNRKIGFVFQMHYLLPQLNLIENILLPTLALNDPGIKSSSRQRAIELLGKVGLDEKLSKYPGQLSVGECQRAAIVRALINHPGIILADEPTGSLDQDSAEQVGELLIQMNKEQNIALLIVTHSIELANKMAVVHKLLKGKLIPY